MIGTAWIIAALRSEIVSRTPTREDRRALVKRLKIHRTYLCMIRSGSSSCLGMMLRIADELQIPIELRIGRRVMKNRYAEASDEFGALAEERISA